MIARIARTLCVRNRQRTCLCRLRCLDRQSCDVQLRGIRSSCELFDGAAVEIARREIHVGEGTTGAQALIHKADTLEQLGPIDVGNQPHTGDDVAHSYVGGNLALLCVLNDLIDGNALQGEPLFQPT